MEQWLKYIGYGGFSWSALAAFNIWGEAGLGAYYLSFNNIEAGASRGPDHRMLGFPLRCLILAIFLCFVAFFGLKCYISKPVLFLKNR